MNGERVLVRGYQNMPYIVRVCWTKRDIVYVTGETNFSDREQGKGVYPIGVKRWEVHPYDEAVYQRLNEQAPNNMTLWNELDIWEGT